MIKYERIIEGHNNVICYEPSEESIVVGFKYGRDKDFFVEFKKCGVNKILQMYRFYEAQNLKKEVDDNIMREKKLLKTATSDFVGPVVVKSLTSDTGYTKKDFTGGWHGYAGGQDGNSTAKTVSYTLYLDGEEQELKDVVTRKVNRVDLKVINYIQGYNTKKESGEGEYVLEETTIYTVIKNVVNVSTTLKALQACVISTYYGLQSNNSVLWDKSITYPLGKSESRMLFEDNVVQKGDNAGQYAGSTSGEHEDYGACRRWVLRGNGGHALCCFMDQTFSMGKGIYQGPRVPNIFTLGYGKQVSGTKTYYNLIKSYMNDGVHLGKSKMISWRGGYIFSNVSNNPESLDYFEIINEYNRKKIIFDCFIPCGNYILNDEFIGKNYKVLVNKGNAEITPTANGISILNASRYGCVELEIVDNTINIL